MDELMATVEDNLITRRIGEEVRERCRLEARCMVLEQRVRELEAELATRPAKAAAPRKART